MVVSASTTGVAWGLSKGVSMAVSAWSVGLGDGKSLRKAEWMVVTEKGEGLLEVSAAASASSSAGEASTFQGKEKRWVMTGASLMVT